MAVGLVLLAALVVESPPGVAGSTVPVIEYRGGHWYDGVRFRQRDLYVQGPVIVKRPERGADRVVDLGGAWVVPGFAEAHHHTVLCDPARIRSFLNAGIVYAAILNARVSSRACQSKFHGPGGLEAINALAGLTARDAHPSQIGRFFLNEKDIDGEWVYYIDSPGELKEKWPTILGAQPDLVKVFLSYSESFEHLRDDPSVPSWYRGIDPALVPGIVARAHGAGLRVAAHVMSATDFEVAVDAGVDFVAHLPGFAPGNAFTPDQAPHPFLAALGPNDPRYRLSSAQAAEAALRGAAVMTTVSEGPEPSATVRHNLEVLRAAGVQLLIGSDRGEFNSVDEAVYLVHHGLLPASEVLHSLSIGTPRTLFPGRKIGRLDAGYEATFVVLAANPLEDFNAIRKVLRVVKKGHPPTEMF
ncbi:MAG: amidohydrolase family protein [Lysobacterales bacterium]|jgi:imidazolonepropionase-like amidohydrolase